MIQLSIALLAWVAVAATSPSPSVAPPATSLAVLDFDNHSGDARYNPLGKGLAAMMVTDLAEVPSLQLVERDRLQDLMEEMELQQSHNFDPATAQEVGLLIGAEYVVFGSIAAIQPRVRLDTRIVQVSTGEIVKTAEVTGGENRLFELQEKLAEELIDGIEISLSPEEREKLRARQEATRIDNLETMLAFSEAMTLFDQDDYVGGTEKMATVARAAPQSLLVRLFYDEARTRAAAAARERLRDAGRGLIRGILQ